MGLETATYISGLVATNPVGATDPKSQGDDHLRLLKSTILATFGNITGAVTATHTELNYIHGVTGVTGSGKIVLDTSPTIGGTLTASTVAATTLTGAGSGITALNASNIASGSLADARLSANVPLLNAANVFTAGTLQVQNAGTALLFMKDTAGGTDSKLWAGLTVTATQFGVASTYTDAGSGVANALLITRSGTTITEIDLSATTLGFAGNVATPHTSVSEVGYQGVPTVTINTNTTLDNTYNGKLLYVTGGDVTFPSTLLVGFSCVVVNNSGGSIQLKQSSTGLWLPGTGFASNSDRTLAYGGMVTVTNFSGVNFMVSGAGAF